MLAAGAARGTLGQLKQLYRRLDVGLALDDAARGRFLAAPTLQELDACLTALAASRAAEMLTQPT
jgi:hypothetical protein